MTVTVETQDPKVTAQLTVLVVDCLQRYIIDYRTQKAKTDLKFVSDRYDEAEAKYLKAQQMLADYRDQNKNVILARTKSTEERLQSEYNRLFSAL